jgi:short-subunit dehydrogenase
VVSQKVAFITGASSGFGAGFARRLARDGYAVALAARRTERLEDLSQEIRRAGGSALVCSCDVSEPEQIRAAIETTERELGPVDLLVNNAGVSGLTYAGAFDAAAVERMMRINFFGMVYATECVLPGMLERGGGQIVAIGSLAGYGGLPKTASYSASKAAVHNFFESLRIDLQRKGIAVTVITPGYVMSEMTDKNEHRMPFLMELDRGVDLMYEAIRKRSRVLSFPRPLSSIVWAAQLFPSWLYDWLGSRVQRQQREG